MNLSASGELIFCLYPLRFRFEALQPVRFPNAAGNRVRGALGSALHSAADPAVYAQLFRPPLPAKGPSGLEQPPRPYVIRAAHLDGLRLTAGDPFHFDVHLFDVTASAPHRIHSLLLAAQELSEQGFGPSRERIRFLGATRVDGEGESLDRNPLCLAVDSSEPPCSCLQIQFVTPMELKNEGRNVMVPEFPILFSRARDRISNLTALYGQVQSAINFKRMSERAAEVRLTHQFLQVVERTRRSSRTGQIHGIGGFTGTAQYEGNLADFLPWLRIAEWTGVGRQTVWGKGQIRVIVPKR